MTTYSNLLKQIRTRFINTIKPKSPNTNVYWFRWAVQTGFVLFSILLGLQFHAFINTIQNGSFDHRSVRPAAVEGYLPISSLMSLIHFLKTGVANTVHPAGLVIFSLTIFLAIVLRRGFCSWVCPFGTVSEWLHTAGKILFGKNFKLPKILDILFRSFKYLLFGFFFYHIILMPTMALHQWIHGSYNRIADVKMYLFFFDISTTSIIVFAVLGILSMLIKNFWCRYLCPYGALLGIFSILSPTAIHRDQKKCTGCQKCSNTCPNLIPVHKLSKVNSPECTACYSCVKSCSKEKSLNLCFFRNRISFSVLSYGLITVALIYFTSQAAQTLGYWHSDTPPSVYQQLYHNIHTIDHPRTSLGKSHTSN